MRDKIKVILPDLVRDIHKVILDRKTRERLSMRERQGIAESALAVAALADSNVLIPHEKVLLDRAFNKAYQIVYDEESLSYYNSFYYAYSTMKGSDLEKQEISLQKINLDTMAMFLKIKAFSRGYTEIGNSTDNYFFSRMDRCIWGLEYILNKKLDELYIPGIYAICNLNQSLCLYILSGHSKFSEKCVVLVEKIYTLVNKCLNNSELKELIDDNHSLRMFIKSQKNLYAETKNEDVVDNQELDVNFKELDNTQLLRVLTSLKIIDKEYFKKSLELTFERLLENIEKMNELQKALLLRNIADYLLLTNETGQVELNLFEPFEVIDIYDYMKNTYKKYQYISSTKVTKEDIDKLIQLNDDQLREKIASVINGVDPVILDRESKKPHGVFEISDMEIPIFYKGKKIFLCMPFKSGQEIKTDSVPVGIAYQIVRPFIEFEKCVVVFITAKKCSQNLENYIKKLQDQMNWPIGIIQERELAGLLKANNAL
ncbi:hypothetical protein P8V03_15975 [Clostridium sp. A1-XYC3]|uniref:Uncharacterized protein n=1 Tax=Clostridium tanneri TaxID=3037988 RepID=A0ABU4JWW2_9CLOT|nr:hypothetical protein [Clostridium sp. A1-XYC3]MDW8802646.1 hypothetical protein [Clostridium sp. A1-XYC3]